MNRKTPLLTSKGLRVFDFGGNLGISFYAWQKYLEIPANIEWVVCDLPMVIREGQRFANERGETRLRFTSRIEDGDGFDFLLMSGCLQFIEEPVGDLLAKMKRLPAHLLINRTPLHESRDCITLHNIGWMVAPYRVRQRDRVIEEIESFGYKLIDAWSDAEIDCWIPFYPEYSVESYSGLYFRLAS
jgi:putative methyltransferase (TIGR04325 family)